MRNESRAPIAIVTALAWAVAATACATTVIELGTEQLVGWSEQIVAGTVVESETSWNDDRTTIVTSVTFAELVFAKGGERSSEKLVIPFSGGRVGDDFIVTDGVPTFEIGGRHVLFIAPVDDASWGFCPVVGMFQGRFTVLEPGTDREAVVDGLGRAVAGFDGKRMIVVDEAPVPRTSGVTVYEVEDGSGVGSASSTEEEVPARPEPPVRAPGAPSPRAEGGTDDSHRVESLDGPRVESTLPIVVPDQSVSGEKVSEAEFLDWLASIAAVSH